MEETEELEARDSAFDFPMTCSVKEFSRIVGICEEKARELVAGADRPPGFYVGSRYRVFVGGLEDWLRDLSRTGRPAVRI